MATDAQRKAVKKYKEKVNRITLDFSPAEAELWEYIQKQPKKQTYIKDLIRADMENQPLIITQSFAAIGMTEEEAKKHFFGRGMDK